MTLIELRANIMDKHLDKIEANRTELMMIRRNHKPMVVITLSNLVRLR